MRRKNSALVVIAAFLIGASFFVAPSLSYAGTITCIDVFTPSGGGVHYIGNFGGGTTCTAGLSGDIRPTWSLPNPIVLLPSQTLVLTQNQNNQGNSNLSTGLPGFNFDTSDVPGAGSGTQAYTIRINNQATTLSDPGILNFGGVDQNSTVVNEAHDWTLISPGGGTPDGLGHLLDVFTGYADTLHSGPCADGGDCLPTSAGPLFPNGTFLNATVALGNGSSIPGYPTSGHCNVGATASPFNCFDAGAILIHERAVTPEPSSLLLIGIGLIGMAAYRRRHLRKSS